MITLATLADATPQQVFDQIANHLRTQKIKAEIKDIHDLTSCAYRTERGLKCAAGCLIDDSEYSPSFEGKSWGTLVQYENLTSKHLELIRNLQAVHDSKDPEIWEHSLELVAREFNLEYHSLEA